MISVSNLRTVQTIYEAFGKGDIPTILEHVSADVIWEAWADNSAQKAGVPWLQNRPGKNGVMEFFQVIGTMQFHDFQVLSIMDGGHQIAAEITLDVTLANGNRFQDEEMHLWTFNDEGKVTRLRHYADTHKHMKAVGIH
ncbi:MAG: nuclear transport factor 2 family protein [Saprospiraceae bacterium]|nr:nuclear transport factor 2 family protein [Saprospiraceae bacterium]